MNKRTSGFAATCALLLLGFFAPLLSASEVTSVWETIYRQAVSDEQRYNIMLKITEMKDKEFAPLVAESLQNLYVNKIESGDASAKRIKLSLAKLLVQELGNLRSMDNAQLVFDVYRNSKDPFLRGESALALGKMRAIEFVELLANDLHDINLQPKLEEARAQEINAYGLVQCLELMHSPVGFEPVFYASIGWYSAGSKVRETARDALKTMVDDPSPMLKDLVVKEVNFDHKLMALQAEADSKAPADKRVEVGRSALDQGLIAQQSDQQTKRVLAAIRLLAVKVLVDAGDKGEETVPLYKRLIEQAPNNDELLAAYVGLGRNASPAAVKLLVKKMGDYNERQKTGAQTALDRPIVSQLVQSLAMTKDPSVKPILIEAQFSNHDAQVVRDVKAALAQFN